MVENLEAVRVELPSASSETQIPASQSNGPLVRFAFAATIFLSAYLLFQVQLILGKYILPLFGGAPSVWNTCMLFFQLLLLLGYAYSHLLSRRVQPRAQGMIHAALLLASFSLFVFLWLKWSTPLTPGDEWKPQPLDNPVSKILQLLAGTVAVPFFLLSTTGPLLQKWFSLAQPGRSPYRLYALSNAGSLLGLLSYPLILEWVFTLKHQARLWSAAYLLFIGACAGLAWRLRNSAIPHMHLDASPQIPEPATGMLARSPGSLQRWLWIALSCCSSTMLLAVTNLICQDLTSLPLLWVLPLSLYLLSFILTFDSHGWYRRAFFWPLYFLFLGFCLKSSSLGYHPETPDTLMRIVVYCLASFSVFMACHGELARSKPSPAHLTSFYFMVGTGGAIGGVFVVLLAPVLFAGYWEFEIALLACGFLLFAVFLFEDRSARSERWSWTIAVAILFAFFVPHLMLLLPKTSAISLLTKEYFSGALAAGLLVLRRVVEKRSKNSSSPGSQQAFPWQPITVVVLLGLFAIVAYSSTMSAARRIVFRERNFFGIKYVLASRATVDLMSGSTLHGVEIRDPVKRRLPTLYYRPDSGIGLLLGNYPRGISGTGNLRVGVIGLGIGTLAAYGHPGDYFRFYEIDPSLLPLSLARPPYFHFVQDSPAFVDIAMGDARLSLEREAVRGNLQAFNVFAVDAFSSDAVPVHLLTREAMGLYLQHLRPADGVLAFHVSSRFVDLAPVIIGLIDSYHLAAVQVRDDYSLWIIASAHPELLKLPYLSQVATPVALKRKSLLWTDAYSNVVAVLNR